MSARGRADCSGSGPGVAPEAGATRRIAAAWVAIDAIRVPHPTQAEAVDGLVQALDGAVLRAEGDACGAVTLIAPRGVGKSAAIAMAMAEAERSHPDRACPMLHVRMDVAGTVESVPGAILAALHDPRPDLGKPALRWLKATTRLREKGVRLVVLDEFNRAARRPTLSGPIGQAICEKIMEAGVAAVAFVGEEDASVALERAPLLTERVDEELDLSPFDRLRPGDEAMWTGIVAAFDAEMVRLGLVAAPTGFGDPDVAGPLCDACGGIVRRFVKTTRLALASAMRRGDRAITRDDLREAVATFSVARRFIDRNPFDGLAR